MDEYWTTQDVADHYGWASTAVARKAIQRWALSPATDRHGHVLRDPDTDAKLYHPADVEAAKAADPGRGRRRTATTERQVK